MILDQGELDRRFLAACAVAREAGDLARSYFTNRDSLKVEFKGPQDYLTAADGAVERLIVARLGAAFAGDTFLGEEGGGTVGPRLWVIDPIDGTANFARGIALFCIAIAFVVDGRTELGVIYDPISQEMFTAVRGGGATCNGRPMRVSDAASLRNAVIEVGWSSRLPIAGYLDLLDRVVGAGASFRRGGSGALGLAYVADGRVDGYVELHINAWDCLAALLMIEEAGGVTNDFLAGGEGLVRGNAVLAAAPGIRDALSQASGIG
ncbi:myo-inositol-1(or 4)-monophosphatase [Stella humosa]|uniref:Inositol-1-monophosphatase n=1 Tax=Stella humosa TaxID=94 RepID=A0A3N1KXN7_9PROT|nr:inositol monophosphatase [Stella humosa]ROP83539.1 myo-inositol-1(or 4)-monophosphatase [Stella humosa]BBK33188.1 inositol monophosphatase [Stella humosa]